MTNRKRLAVSLASLCLRPQYILDNKLRKEGFSFAKNCSSQSGVKSLGTRVQKFKGFKGHRHL